MVDYVSGYTGAQIDAAIARTNVVSQGWQNFQDTSTATTRLSLPLADTWYDLPNNALGPLTNTDNRVPTNAILYDANTGLIDFSNLSVGDRVMIRVDIEAFTAGQNRDMSVKLAFGPGFVFSFSMASRSFRKIVSGGAQGQITGTQIFFMLTSDTVNNPAKLQVISDSAGDEVKVNGWAFETQLLGY